MPIDVINIMLDYTTDVITCLKNTHDFTAYVCDNVLYASTGDVMINNKTADIYICLNFCVCSIYGINHLLVVKHETPNIINILSLSHESIYVLKSTSAVFVLLCYNNILAVQRYNSITTYKINHNYKLLLIKSIQKGPSSIYRILYMDARFIFVSCKGTVEVYDTLLNLLKSIQVGDTSYEILC